MLDDLEIDLRADITACAPGYEAQAVRNRGKKFSGGPKVAGRSALISQMVKADKSSTPTVRRFSWEDNG